MGFLSNSVRVAALVCLTAGVACTKGSGDPAASGEATVPRLQTPAEDITGGSIKGRVIYKGTAPDRQKLLVVKDVETCSQIDHYDDRLIVGKEAGIQNAVVSLEGLKGELSLAGSPTEVVLDQRDCAYRPRVLLLPVGMPLQILNSDNLLHNVHTFSEQNKPFNIAQPKYLTKIERTFEKPERVSVRCDVHGWMSAWVVVVDHPHHAITDTGGSFALDNIPPGTYTLTSWQELLGERQMEVTVDAGAMLEVDFEYMEDF